MIRQPLISVIVPTMRVGGIDVLWAGLRDQTLQSKDWELVLVDCIKPWRRDLGLEGAVTMGTHVGFTPQILWMEPHGNRFPLNQYCRAMNTGIRAARGKICLFLVDYTVLPQNCLERHVTFHEKNRNSVLMAPHRTVECPKLCQYYPGYRQSNEHYTFEGIDRYNDDLRSGLLDSCNWSIFDELFSSREYLKDLPEVDRTVWGHDPKIEKPAGECEHTFFYCRNESVLRSDLLSVNGFDENLDGSHGYQDHYIAGSLKTRLGLTFVNDPENVATIVNPRKYFPHAKRDRPISNHPTSNEAVLERLARNNYHNTAGIYQLP